MEELQANVKKKQKPPPRLTELEELVNRHKDHIEKLEKLLRCIDNETITPDEMDDLKSDLDMYLVGCRLLRGIHLCAQIYKTMPLAHQPSAKHAEHQQCKENDAPCPHAWYFSTSLRQQAAKTSQPSTLKPVQVCL